MDIRAQIEHKLKNLLDVEVKVVVPETLDKGDYSSNIALASFAGFKSKHKTPYELAEYIVARMNEDASFSSDFEKIEVVDPGFINFFLSKRVLSTHIYDLLNGRKKLDNAAKTTKLVFEYGDPNPFKEPHIGHLRNFVLGESLSRLMESIGRDIVRTSYQGDVGLHVAKAIWGMMRLDWDKVQAKTIEQKIYFLGQSYALGAKEYENSEKSKEEIVSINSRLYQNEPTIMKIWRVGRSWSLENFETLYQTLGIKYDKYYFESETAPYGKEIVTKNSPKVFEQHDDAYVFRGEPFGLHTRVFVTKGGYATYEGKDLALAFLKKKDFGDVPSIIMTANEQVEYFKVILKALSLLDEDLGIKTTHLSFGFVNLKDGKMSSRSGNIVSASWLLNETRQRLKNSFKEISEAVLDQLAVGAVKWSMLKFSRDSNIAFSFEDSISVEGNSGPYLQYSFARTQSILAKKNEAKDLGELEAVELALARAICQYETVRLDAANTFSPNILCNYLFRLSQEFNSFYEKEKIIGSDKEEQRILLTKAVGEVLQQGLNLLGIDAPKKI